MRKCLKKSSILLKQKLITHMIIMKNKRKKKENMSEIVT